MKKQTVYEVFVTSMHGFQGYAIMTPEGDLNTFYPGKFREPENPGYCSTVEVSTELFSHLAMLQSQGCKIVFKH